MNCGKQNEHNEEWQVYAQFIMDSIFFASTLSYQTVFLLLFFKYFCSHFLLAIVFFPASASLQALIGLLLFFRTLGFCFYILSANLHCYICVLCNFLVCAKLVILAFNRYSYVKLK